ncbi:hypothetical protein [Paenisporosarcina cavernae]|uniref:Uncharacterized protein n=1 Tax=Paenisporosarcina cavernae TaxID=2320858 RepID=A0A385YTB9_9BACL|nr:hypothetical protein [Paenisporosarcina cavernae]AYC29761.1 hypothetical protein D3873_07590 [Paenisporosarcina cavernae]
MQLLIGMIFGLVCVVIVLLFVPGFHRNKHTVLLGSSAVGSFLLAFWIGILYTPLIGVLFFILLSGALAILLGKKHLWYDRNHWDKTSNTYIHSKAFHVGNDLEEVTSTNDTSLFVKSLRMEKPLTTDIVQSKREVAPTLAIDHPLEDLSDQWMSKRMEKLWSEEEKGEDTRGKTE